MGNLILLIGAVLILLCFSLPLLIVGFWDIADMRRNAKRSRHIQEECDQLLNQLG